MPKYSHYKRPLFPEEKTKCDRPRKRQNVREADVLTFLRENQNCFFEDYIVTITLFSPPLFTSILNREWLYSF